MKIAAPSTKTDYVYQNLRKEILEGHLSPGRRLRLVELAKQYEISEMPVREALRMLQRDGLVRFESHRGATVTDLSIERAIEIIATRTYLEVLAACEACPFHTKASIEKLRDIIEAMRGARTAAKFSTLNRAFHLTLYEPGPNGFLKAQIEELWDKVWRTRSKSIFELRPDRVKAATDEHEDIVSALATGSLDKVEAAARHHRDLTLQSWQSLIAAPATDR